MELGDENQLHTLLFDFDWLSAKVARLDIHALLQDFDLASENEDLTFLQSAVRFPRMFWFVTRSSWQADYVTVKSQTSRRWWRELMSGEKHLGCAPCAEALFRPAAH
jgi:hypothetical protein